MKQNNYIGYKVPKTLKYESIEIRNDLNKIPELANFNDFYYIFYNERLKNYIIPQKVNKLKYNTLEKDSINITRFLTYLKKLKYDKVNGVLLKKECEEIFILPILNLVKEVSEKDLARLKERERRYNEALQKLKNTYNRI
jgi:hypothetical protein